MDKKLINRISRQWTLTEKERSDYAGYDDIVAMKWDGIPNLKDEDYYVEFRDTTGRDIVQQAVNIYSTQRPKWDVLPRGLGDIDTAEEFERIIEWYMWKAAQMGRTPFHSEALINACKYNKICGQIEWTDEYAFCVKIYHPSTVVYEYGSKLQWVSVVNNVTAVSIIEHWSDYAKPNWVDKLTKGDSIGSALKEIQKLADDDPEQRMMYVDYTDNKRRYTYCYPVNDETVDDSLGFNDSGEVKDLGNGYGSKETDFILIQDKANELGFINWAIAEGIGDPLLAPLLKGNLYNNINDAESLKRTIAFRRAFYPMFIQQGREDADADIDMSGAQVVLKTPTGASITPTVPPPLDATFNELSAQDRNIMTNSLGISSTATLEASNVQHSTLTDMIKLRLAQLDPYKKVDEQFNVQIAYLIFKWSKKKEKILKGQVLHASETRQRGSEISIEPDDINLDALYIECKILPNNENDKLQITNQIAMLKQSGIPIPSDEYVEMLYMGSPDVLRAKWEKEQLRDAVLQANLKEIISAVDEAMQMRMAQFTADLQQQGQAQQMAMQQQAQGALPQQAPVQQGQPLPSDAMTQGMGMNAGMGGMPPQEANSGITQAQR